MANMSFSVDMDRIQSTVQAKIRPAVEAALAEVDVQSMIQSELLAMPAQPSRDDHISMSMLRFGYQATLRPKIEEMVSRAIHDVAEEFVRKNVRAQRDSIEDALTGMLARSNNKLVKAFSGAIENAFKADWSFDLEVKVAHSTAETDRD
jgi:hypothetical protein